MRLCTIPPIVHPVLLCDCGELSLKKLLDLGLVVADQVVPVLLDLGQLVVLSTVIEPDREKVKNRLDDDNRDAINDKT